MFYSLTGNVVAYDATFIAIECGGVAFKCSTSAITLKKTAQIGSKATLYTYLAVRENALDLFGFASQKELEFFKLLIGVSGVGPKVAVSILSEFEPEQLVLCIASGDNKTLTRAQNVGAKMAQKIIMELKDKIGGDAALFSASASNESAASAVSINNSSEAVYALEALGYSRMQAAKVVSKIDNSLSLEDTIKAALQILAKEG